MATEKINQRLAAIKSVSKNDQADLTILMNALVDGIRALTVLLDNDAGVTGTTYTATFDAIITKS